MTVHVLGSSGFISTELKLQAPPDFVFWGSSENNPHYFDLYNYISWRPLLESRPRSVFINSWPGLPNYHQPFHLTKILPAMIQLIDALIDNSCKKIIVSGTCYEYGNCSGMLSEDQVTNPTISYSIAKDALRKYIESKYLNQDFQYVWTRIFYPYGSNQSKNSLYPSLIKAIKDNEPAFYIGSASQCRDFIPIDQVISDILALITKNDACGIYNICSGAPQSILNFCSAIKTNQGSSIKLIVDDSLIRSSESHSFWGNRQKLLDLLGQ